jgi:hypothetical protein
MARDGGVLRLGAGRLALPRAAGPAWLRGASTVLFYGYVGLLIVAGAWGIVFAGVDQSALIGLDLDELPATVRANHMSQYRFLRAIELGFGLWAFIHRDDIHRVATANRLFLFTMAAGVAARGIGVVVDGSPSPVMYAFAGWELVGVVTIYGYTRRTLRSSRPRPDRRPGAQNTTVD